jgi:arylformamidase
MHIYDITVPLSPTLPVYPGDPTVTVTPVTALAQGDAANVSHIGLSSHSGTHLDAPRHFFSQGQAIDALDVQVLLGPALVWSWPHRHHISADDLRALPLQGVTRLLFKTPNSQLWGEPAFQRHYVALTEAAAHLLLARGVQLVGIDYLSVDAFEQQDFPVHRTLLGAGTLILEGLDLRSVAPGMYELLVLPLLLQDGDGAPARAVLRR